VLWTFKGSNHSDNVIFSSSPHPHNSVGIHELMIVSANKSNEGKYVCQGKDVKYDKYLYFSSTTSVYVIGKIMIYYIFCMFLLPIFPIINSFFVREARSKQKN